jgi:hypothetical protein
MSFRSTVKVPITAGGGTVTTPISAPYEVLHLYTTGATVLAGNWTFTSSGSLYEGYTIELKCELTNITVGAQVVTFYGEVINTNILENTNFTAIATYSGISGAGGKFIVTVFPDFEGTGFIDTTVIKDDAITQDKIADDAVGVAQLEAIARGSLIVGGVANAPTLRDFKTSAQIPIGNGTDINSVAVSGDVTISSTGVTTIGANKITEAMLNFTLTSYLEVTRTLTSTEILALRTTAITLLSAPGANKYYELISVSAYNNYNSTTYNAGTDVLNLEVNGVALWTLPNAFIEATSSTATYGTKVADALIATNTAVNLRMSSADPTTGNGTIKVSAIYRIITGE